MSFAILRVKKHKNYGTIAGIGSHVERTRFTPNANPNLLHLNQRTFGSANLISDVKSRLENASISKIRKDGVIMIEHMITASPEYFEGWKNDQKKLNNWYLKTKNWLHETYGSKNVVNITVHLDEKTPHLHAMVVPIELKKTGRFAGQNRLNAKKWTGGRKIMSEMQDSYAAALELLGLKRGKKGSKALHNRVGDFYADANEVVKKLEEQAVNQAITKVKSEVLELKLHPEKVLKRELNQEIQDLNNQISNLKREKEDLEENSSYSFHNSH
ncbi:MAG: hypothetical protein HAW67_06310 [Endozoicomonadaceae bacterium]|nr:hypothetical protein [Endozoicomonadaceae bacterium]